LVFILKIRPWPGKKTKGAKNEAGFKKILIFCTVFTFNPQLWQVEQFKKMHSNTFFFLDSWEFEKSSIETYFTMCYSNFIFGSDFHDQNLFLKRSEKLENNSAGTSSFWRFQGALIGRFRSVGSQDRPDKTCATIGSDLWELRKQ
jgi:hypothetical protein